MRVFSRLFLHALFRPMGILSRPMPGNGQLFFEEGVCCLKPWMEFLGMTSGLEWFDSGGTTIVLPVSLYLYNLCS